MPENSDIEGALKQLPIEQKWQVAEWLLKELHASAAQKPITDGEIIPEMPDFAERRRKIFGDTVLPNLILEARGEESR